MLRRRRHGQVVRVLDLYSGGLRFKSSHLPFTPPPWWHHVNSQVVCLLLVGILKYFVFVSVTVKQYWIVIEMALFIKYYYHYTMKFCVTLGTETKKGKKIPIT